MFQNGGWHVLARFHVLYTVVGTIWHVLARFGKFDFFSITNWLYTDLFAKDIFDKCVHWNDGHPSWSYIEQIV